MPPWTDSVIPLICFWWGHWEDFSISAGAEMCLELSTLDADWGSAPPRASAGPPPGGCGRSSSESGVVGVASTQSRRRLEPRGLGNRKKRCNNTEHDGGGYQPPGGPQHTDSCLGHTKGRCQRPSSACRGFLPYTLPAPGMEVTEGKKSRGKWTETGVAYGRGRQAGFEISLFPPRPLPQALHLEDS